MKTVHPHSSCTPARQSGTTPSTLRQGHVLKPTSFTIRNCPKHPRDLYRATPLNPCPYPKTTDWPWVSIKITTEILTQAILRNARWKKESLWEGNKLEQNLSMCCHLDFNTVTLMIRTYMHAMCPAMLALDVVLALGATIRQSACHVDGIVLAVLPHCSMLSAVLVHQYFSINATLALATYVGNTLIPSHHSQLYWYINTSLSCNTSSCNISRKHTHTYLPTILSYTVHQHTV